MTIAPMFILDAPCYPAAALGSSETFRGVALALGGVPVTEVVAYREGRPIGHAPVDGESPELGWVPVPGSSRCRFSFLLPIERGAPIELRTRDARGREVAVFVYDVPFLEREEARLAALWQRVRRLPVPPPDVVAVTQGLGNVDEYRASTAASLLTFESLLGAAGTEISRIRSVLDVGCGTGRLLVGWHCDGPERRLFGTDINPALVAWCRANLADVARWGVNGVEPPLDFEGGSFDLVILASVFTHLSLGNQRAWAAEIRRLVSPGGHAVVTLHGDVYAAAFLRDGEAESFARDGYVERAAASEGANAYTTFHSERFARELFADFRGVTRFPRGVAGPVARHVPIAAQQDVYVLDV